jgi:hypothetical protein
MRAAQFVSCCEADGKIVVKREDQDVAKKCSTVVEALRWIRELAEEQLAEVSIVNHPSQAPLTTIIIV